MNKTEAVKELDKLKAEALNKIREMESLADEHGLSFYFSVAYGMGGWYYSETAYRKEFGYDDHEAVGSEDIGWQPSSMSC